MWRLKLPQKKIQFLSVPLHIDLEAPSPTFKMPRIFGPEKRLKFHSPVSIQQPKVQHQKNDTKLLELQEKIVDACVEPLLQPWKSTVYGSRMLNTSVTKVTPTCRKGSGV